MSKKSLTAQRIANAFPLWTDLRNDDQSLGRQFLNPVGNTMDEMREQIQKASDNYYLSTACVSDIDVYYYTRLPKTFEFRKEDDDDTEWLFTPPPVSGVVDGTKYTVSLADENNVESFWYTALPTRISLETTVSSGTCLLASGVMEESPIPVAIPSGIIDTPNKLQVTVSGGYAYIHTDDSNHSSQTIIQIKGTTRPGAKVTEELYFIHADTQQTRYDYQQVEEVRCYYTPYNTTATVKVETSAFNQVDYPAAYQLAANQYREDVLMYWGLSDGPLSGQRKLNVRKYDTDEVLNRLGGYTNRHDFDSFELVDTEGNYVAAQDLTVEPHSNRIWVVGSGMLYLYDGDLYYPNMKTMVGRNYDAPAVIEPNYRSVVPGESVQLFYTWKRPLSEITRYRIWTIKPDGTKKSIDANGNEVTYVTGASSWLQQETTLNRHIQKPTELTLTQPGDHTFCLEVGYVDGSSSIDKKIVSVQRKQALAQFPIGQTTGDWRPIVGIDMDSEYKIWLRNKDNARYQINLHYDNMLIDWKRKLIYFREPYDQVRVFDYTD